MKFQMNPQGIAGDLDKAVSIAEQREMPSNQATEGWSW
jgi:hypothetical protein